MASAESPFSNFYPNTFFDHKQEKEAFDGTIEYSDAVVVMEYKGGMLNASAKYSGSRDLLIQEMDKKFGRAQKDSGVRQLATQIEGVYHADESRRLRIRGLDLSKKRKVFPILIVNETNFEFSLANWHLRKFVRD